MARQTNPNDPYAYNNPIDPWGNNDSRPQGTNTVWPATSVNVPDPNNPDPGGGIPVPPPTPPGSRPRPPGTPPSGTPVPRPDPNTPPPPPTPPATPASRLMETTAGIGDRAQMLKSPKAAFLTLATQFGYADLDKLLAALQSDPELARLFNGWEVTGNGDTIEYRGDPSQLATEWGGITNFDVIGSYNPETGEAEGWRWGVGEGGTSNAGGQNTSQPGNLQNDVRIGTTPLAPTTPIAPSSSSTPTSPDPFTSIGGGVWTGTGWVPRDHPEAQNVPPTAGNPTDPDYSDPEVANDELWRMLMERAQQGLDVGRDDPNVRNQTDAYSAQQERSRRNYLADLAESSSPYSTGMQRTADRMTAETMGQNVGAMEADLIGKEITARRNEIQQALTQMGNLLTDQQRQALERELAQMNDAVERLRLQQQNAQFYASLSQADQQFLDELGFRNTEAESYWDYLRRNPGSTASRG